MPLQLTGIGAASTYGSPMWAWKQFDGTDTSSRTASKKEKKKLRKQRTWRLSLTASAPKRLKIFIDNVFLSVQRVGIEYHTLSNGPGVSGERSDGSKKKGTSRVLSKRDTAVKTLAYYGIMVRTNRSRTSSSHAG